jgi:hypothetical protein
MYFGCTTLAYYKTGLPDGLFSNQSPKFGTFWKPFEWEILISFIMVICFILWKFGICFAHLLYYPHFGILYQ